MSNDSKKLCNLIQDMNPVDTATAAQLLNVSLVRVRQLVNSGRLSSVSVCGRRLVCLASIVSRLETKSKSRKK